MIFLERFGDGTIYSSFVGYKDYALTTSTQLVWPELGDTSSNLAAMFIRASTTVTGAGFIMPDATQVSTGRVNRFRNTGSVTLPIYSQSGSTIASVNAGQDYLLTLIDNTTSGGIWDTEQLGVGTSSADASFLAGNGLTVSGSKLVANWPVVYTGSDGYQLTESSRAVVTTWTGGAGTIVVPSPGLSNGYITALKNAGTGALTVSSTIFHTIDGDTSITLYPNDSTYLAYDGALKYQTIGLTNGSAAFDSLEIDVSNQSTVTLTSGQINNKIFVLSGTVDEQGCTIVFPQIPGNFLIINQTFANNNPIASSGFIYIQTSAVGGESVSVPFNSQRSIVSDGANIYYAEDLTTLAPTPNVLYYADFSKNPWQRGTSFTSSSVYQYTADRVSVLSPSGSNYVISRAASTNLGCQYDLRVQRISGSPSASGVACYLGFDLSAEESIPLRGQNVTMAFEVSYGSSGSMRPVFDLCTNTTSNQRVIDTVVSGTGTWTLGVAEVFGPTGVTNNSGYYTFVVSPAVYTGSETLTSNLNQVSVLATLLFPGTTGGPNDFINISRVGLFQGNFAGWDNPDAISVQQKCQQFAYVVQSDVNSQPIGGGQCLGTNAAGIFINFPSTLRQTPTLATPTASQFALLTSTGGVDTCSSIAIGSGGSRNTALLTVGTVSGLLAAGDATVMLTTTTASKLVFSADL